MSLGFQSCAWLLGCRMLGEILHPYSPLSLTEYAGRVQVQITKSTWCTGDFLRVSHQSHRRPSERHAAVPCPEDGGPACLALAPRIHTGPFLNINTTHFHPSPSYPEPQWWVLFVGVLPFPSIRVEDQILLEVFLWGSPRHFRQREQEFLGCGASSCGLNVALTISMG